MGLENEDRKGGSLSCNIYTKHFFLRMYGVWAFISIKVSRRVGWLGRGENSD